MQWILAFHIIFMVTWFAGLFYLPRLYVYHTMSNDKASIERFKIMERKLLYGITTPGGILTTVFGVWLWSYSWGGYMQMGWFHAKMFLVALLWVFHIYCWKLYLDFKNDKNKHTHVFYRWLNEFPVVVLVGAVILAIVKPF